MNVRFFIIGAVFFAVLGVLVFQATKTSSAVVFTPTELVQKGTAQKLYRIRVGGRVADKDINYQLEPEIQLSFFINDPTNPSDTLPVVYKGLKPDMFAPGRDVILDGDLIGGTIRATKLLTQCPSKYEPPVPTKSDPSESKNKESVSY